MGEPFRNARAFTKMPAAKHQPYIPKVQSDTRQRVYQPLDTCSAGSWIEECQYNKRRNKKTLTGNWYEDRVLDEGLKEDGFLDETFRGKMRLDEEHLDINQSKQNGDIRHTRAKAQAVYNCGFGGKMYRFFDDGPTTKKSLLNIQSTNKLFLDKEEKCKSLLHEEQAAVFSRECNPSKYLTTKSKRKEKRDLALKQQAVLNVMKAVEKENQDDEDLYQTMYQMETKNCVVPQRKQEKQINYSKPSSQVLTSFWTDTCGKETFGKNVNFSTPIEHYHQDAHHP